MQHIYDQMCGHRQSEYRTNLSHPLAFTVAFIVFDKIGEDPMPCVFELLENPTVAALLGAVIGAAIGGFSSYIITVRVSRRTELK